MPYPSYVLLPKLKIKYCGFFNDQQACLKYVYLMIESNQSTSSYVIQNFNTFSNKVKMYQVNKDVSS